MKYKIDYKVILADTITPVALYLRIRDHYPRSILLESSDHTHKEGSLSMICVDPIKSIEVINKRICTYYKDEVITNDRVADSADVLTIIKRFIDSFDRLDAQELPFYFDGLYGYSSYDAVQYFEDIQLADRPKQIPDLVYSFYRAIIVFDHFKHQTYIIENSAEGQAPYLLNDLLSFMYSGDIPRYTFSSTGAETSNMDDANYEKLVVKAQQNCARGDVFQVVLSRGFEQGYTGDDFNVYRALRRINPSPYMFYFDMGNYRILGSSPEAQIIIENDRATITPIAGTYKRTGNDQEDQQQAALLLQDPKEKSEHTMLVDLARNDLSRQGDDVQIEELAGIQMYSHVIHIVSRVSARLNSSALKMYSDTFPAGTLSGAPKYRAMQLIDEYEPNPRQYYGGAIGFLGFNGSVHHAILIRSALSKDGILSFQAGAGIVMQSDPVREREEVIYKTNAMRSAIKAAESINKMSLV